MSSENCHLATERNSILFIQLQIVLLQWQVQQLCITCYFPTYVPFIASCASEHNHFTLITFSQRKDIYLLLKVTQENQLSVNNKLQQLVPNGKFAQKSLRVAEFTFHRVSDCNFFSYELLQIWVRMTFRTQLKVWRKTQDFVVLRKRKGRKFSLLFSG